MTEINYNHRHKHSGGSISTTNGQITVGDIRDAIAGYPDHAEVHVSVCDHGGIQKIFGFKSRGPEDLEFRVGGVDQG